MSENNPALAPWWRRPIGMGLLGLVLMVGGLKLSTWVPISPQEEQQAQKLADLRRMAGEGELGTKVDTYAPHAQRTAPYQIQGRLAVFAGLVLFVVAGVRMYRSPASVEPAPVSAVEEQEAAPSD